MPKREVIIVDVASCPIDGVETFIEDGDPPENYKNADAIARWQEEYRRKAIERSAIDIDLGRISALGMLRVTDHKPETPDVLLCPTEEIERVALQGFSTLLLSETPPTLVTFYGHGFDLPLIMRRALYLGVFMPSINVDKYRSPHLDLCAMLSGNDRKAQKPLGFFCRRLGWSDITKPLSGAQEALAPSLGQWEELRASVVHDLTATGRLGAWMGVL